MNWTWLKRRNIKRQRESLLIIEQNNAITSNYVKVNIVNTQKNSKYMLCGVID